ncbi:MAG TPA: TolC family protein [Bryobacteraceae bacterium]
MKPFQSYLALLCVALLCVGTLEPSFAQNPPSQPEALSKPEDQTPRLDSQSPHWYSPFVHSYDPKILPPITISNSSRIDSLLRGGNLYLSLQDAVALALENNIDIEVQRYGFLIADENVKLAQAGGLPSTSPVTPEPVAASVTSAGAPGGGAGLTTFGGGNTVSVAGGINPLLAAGSAIPFYDPQIIGTLQWGHTTTPEQNTITSGTTSLTSQNSIYNVGVTQGFSSGAAATVSYNNLVQDQNSVRNLLNPYTTASVGLTVTQPLLQGFGLALNRRNIRIARNFLKVNDYVFAQQVISTVANVVQLYWNLVSYIENVEVEQQSLVYSNKLLEDNKKQVEIGTLAPVEVTRANAELSSDEQNLLIGQTTVRQQEVLLKNAISRNGIASPEIAEAHVVPTDRIRVPEVEPVRPMQDLISEALDKRPDLAETRIQLENTRIGMIGIRDAMRPTLNMIGTLSNNALTGQTNPLLPTTSGVTTTTTAAPPVLLGGYGNILAQLAGRNFPNYTAGFQLDIPLRNRAAQANMAIAQLQMRQNELEVQKSVNQIRQDVSNALIAIDQARARYDAAEKAVVLEQQLLDAEQKKYALGTSTPFNVISVQRDLANTQLSDVQALTAYGLAKVQLDQSLGTVLESNRIEMEEAKTGKVSRPPSPIPDLNRTGNLNNGGEAHRPPGAASKE